MHKTIAILGRQPKLGLAELESLYGSDNVKPYGRDSALLEIDNESVDFHRLGGSIRIAKILTRLPSSDWKEIEKYILNNIEQIIKPVEGKLSFGISSFGTRASVNNVARTALNLKKTIKESGQSVRMVPHKSLTLGSAVVLYNKLTSKKGWELLVVSDGKTAYLAKTINIQDIDAYSARDQARPHRDAKVGMLPPKLAQIILNLAISDRNVKRVLDPFCGTGVLLQEATLMNYDVLGTDIEPRMVQYSIDNLQWIREKYPDKGDYMRIEIGDATRHEWQQPIDTVAAETFLGHPLSSLPGSAHLSKIIYEANVINHRFLQNIAQQLKPGDRLCLGVPTWRGKHEFLHLPMLDHLTEMGYTRVRFEHSSTEDLIYHRDGQVVGRELLVLVKN